MKDSKANLTGGGSQSNDQGLLNSSTAAHLSTVEEFNATVSPTLEEIIAKDEEVNEKGSYKITE
jgi:hypothetical protein